MNNIVTYVVLLFSGFLLTACSEPDETQSFHASLFGHNAFYLEEYLSSSDNLIDSIEMLNNDELNNLIKDIQNQTNDIIDSIKVYETKLLIASGNGNIDIDSLKYASDLTDLKNLNNHKIPTEVLLGDYSNTSAWSINKLGKEIQNYNEFIGSSTSQYNVILPKSFGANISNKEYLNHNEMIPWAAYIFDQIELYKALGELKGIELEIATSYYITLKTILKFEEGKSVVIEKIKTVANNG